ncbi:MAG: PAS domain S-box protein [Verrucomicrobia subdivision 3 bacterium]|nr:PAS domain S-box protein [Limisphaerales bacterium]
MNRPLDTIEFFKRKPVSAPPAPPPPPAQSSFESSVDSSTGLVAAITLDAQGKIVAVDDGCSALFGWKGSELVGQHLKVLMKNWPDDNITKFLQRPRKPDAQLLSLRVTARRMDGREFPATLTRLAWIADRPADGKPAGVHGCWTAVFREVSASAHSPPVPAMPHDNYTPSGPATARLEDAPQFQGSVAALRSANEELQKKLEAMSLEAWKKNEALNKIDKEHAEVVSKLAKEHAEAVAQLSTRQTELERTRSQLEGEIAQRKLLDSQMHELSAARSSLEAQLADLNRGKEQLIRSSADLREQVTEAKAAAQRARAAQEQEAARAESIKLALTNLQHTTDALNVRVAAEQQLALDAKRRVEELESVLRGTAAEAERANAELDRHTGTLTRVQVEAQEQIRAARATAERAEAVSKQEAARADRLERELHTVRQAHDELNARVKSDHLASADSIRRIRELENTLRETTAELERATTLAQKQRTERSRAEAELQEQINAAKSAAERAEAAHKQELTRANRLESDLATLRQINTELQNRIASDSEATTEASRLLRQKAAEFSRAKAVSQATEFFRRDPAEPAARAADPIPPGELAELERRLRDGLASLVRVTSEVEKERNERRRVEQQFATLSAQMGQLQEELKRRNSSGNTSKSPGWQRDKAA